jgi:hypothetical protein
MKTLKAPLSLLGDISTSVVHSPDAGRSGQVGRRGAPRIQKYAIAETDDAHMFLSISYVSSSGVILWHRQVQADRADLKASPYGTRTGRTLPASLSKRLSWVHLPCCCSTSIECLRLLLAVEDSALRQPPLTTTASADFSTPFPHRCRCRTLARPDSCRDHPG